MKRLTQLLAVTGFASALLLCASNLSAQDNPPAGGGTGGDRGGRGGGRGGFGGDPAQFQQMRMERYRDDLGIKDDTEWKAIEPLVTKVMDAQRDAFSGMGRGMFGRGGRGGRGGGDNNSGDANAARRPRFGPEPSEADQALEKVIDDKNATKDQLKSAMAKVRTEKKDAQVKLTTAQDELKKVLTTKQEAVALTLGLVQ